MLEGRRPQTEQLPPRPSIFPKDSLCSPSRRTRRRLLEIRKVQKSAKMSAKMSATALSLRLSFRCCFDRDTRKMYFLFFCWGVLYSFIYLIFPVFYELYAVRAVRRAVRSAIRAFPSTFSPSPSSPMPRTSSEGYSASSGASPVATKVALVSSF